MKKVAVISIVLLLSGLCFAQATVAGHAYALAPRAVRPLAGITVSLYSPIAARPGPVATAVTGADGSYQFANVEVGTYTIVATGRGFAQVRPIEINVTRAVARMVVNVYLVPLRADPVAPGNSGGWRD